MLARLEGKDGGWRDARKPPEVPTPRGERAGDGVRRPREHEVRTGTGVANRWVNQREQNWTGTEEPDTPKPRLRIFEHEKRFQVTRDPGHAVEGGARGPCPAQLRKLTVFQKMLRGQRTAAGEWPLISKDVKTAFGLETRKTKEHGPRRATAPGPRLGLCRRRSALLLPLGPQDAFYRRGAAWALALTLQFKLTRPHRSQPRRNSLQRKQSQSNHHRGTPFSHSHSEGSFHGDPRERRVRVYGGSRQTS